ncbi:MAG: hypothetical protein A2X71_02595 [Thiobacillus sp. GWE1_62_9]|nr:MAG: hypothetical protein A2X71_02595 [Thiobacillus sp. GWE1_62_9]HBU30437.1 hypothetical protein [Thiobacillus sp.]
MDAAMLYALRDPAGIPSHPVIFLVLGVLTWALHIAAVQVMLGASALTLYGAFSRDAHWRRLAAAMITTAKVAVSVAIVLGVAPLLFVQVIYDPFWYTSNVLSARWVIGFIVILILAYLAMYAFYYRNPKLASQPTRSAWQMVASLVLMLVVGWIMHVLSYQMLLPEQWMGWYAPNGNINPGGQALHAYSITRFAFFILLSVAVVAAWLFAYRRYLMGRPGEDAGYIAWLLPLAHRLMLAGGVLAVASGALWLATLPEKMAWFATSAWVWASAIALLAAAFFPRLLGNKLDQGLWGYAPFALGAVALIVVAAAREALRFVTLLGSHGYDALDYKINLDWYSTSLFFITFAVLGGVVLGYLLTVAWKAGQTKGVYTPSPALTRLGNLSIGLLVIWIVQYFAIGFYVWAR